MGRRRSPFGGRGWCIIEVGLVVQVMTAWLETLTTQDYGQAWNDLVAFHVMHTYESAF